jgi:hypothetical protein
MALTDLWNQDRAQLLDKRVQQIIAFAGAGKLGDDSDASTEFRNFLKVLPTKMLGAYANECLESGFQDSGFALQDLVNQIGRRLGFSVTDGRYRGKQGVSGHDGLWRLPDDHAILVEVKTTDTYRIDLNTLADYRRSLIASASVHPDKSSTLIVVGRQDTGDLEAQIRGSRHAWEIRLISLAALLRLLRLKEAVEDPQTIQRIHAILVPREFTRLDEIVEIIFSTAEDVKAEEPDADDPTEPAEIIEQAGPTPVSFHAACAARLEKHLATTLVRTSKSSYSSPDNHLRLTCSISKQHEFAGDEAYWFAFHPYYLDFLKQADQAFVSFGCGSDAQLFLIPLSAFEPWLEGSYVTKREDRFYWHVQIFRDGASWYLKRKQQVGNVDLTAFLIVPKAVPPGMRPNATVLPPVS